ncbi:Rpp14/Pop5 family-domain-containing protein [Dendryphion nanum]|uniref:Ribonuclease P/MRP protein subunit POP5 n=1 Tax=Dendryphion nanum TaxID=256645 RepID=A0A9P9E2Y9_9PLEO|nr:Rpp14/Pop5 family-domain-containing protein [Dendryphion nanum]
MVRIKHRYLVVNYLYPSTITSTSHTRATDDLPALIQFHRPTPDKFDQRALREAIQDGVLDLYGEYGSGMTSQGLKIIYHSTATSTSIIRCPQAHYQMIWSALTFITRLGRVDVPVVVKVVRVSGTIKKAEEEVIRRAKDVIMRARIAEKNQSENSVQELVLASVNAAAALRRREEEVLVAEGSEEEDSD